MSQSSSFFSSNSSAKLRYNKHFPRSFLLNYGAALQDPKEEAILKRLHDFNCEWLQRPNITISELAQTLRENLPLLQQYSETIFMPEFVEDLASRLEPLKDVLSRLDNKDKSTSQPGSRDDVVSLLRTIDGDPKVEDFALEGLNAAGPLFMVCVHLLVPLTLMRNPEEYAEKARRTPQNASFKEDPSPRRMREFILNSVTKRRRPTSAGSIWDSIDEPEEDEGQPGPSQRRRPAHARRRSESRTPLPSLWEEQESAVLDSQGQRPVPHVSRKRCHSTTPTSSQEVYTQRDPEPAPALSKWKRRAQPPTSTPLARPKPASRPESSSASSSAGSEASSSSEDEAAQQKKAEKPAVKAKMAPQAAAGKRPAAATTKVSASKAKAKAKKVSISSSESSSDSSSDEEPAAKKKAASTASSSSAGKASASTNAPEKQTTQSSAGPKAKPKGKGKA